MARDHARVYCSIWGDPDWRRLPQNAQWLYLLSFTQLDISNAGVLAYRPAAWAQLADGMTPAAIKRGLKLLVERGYFVVDETTAEVLVRTFIRHDRVLRQPNVAVNMARAARQIVSPAIRRAFDEELVRLREDDDQADPMKGWAQPEVATLLTEAMLNVR